MFVETFCFHCLVGRKSFVSSHTARYNVTDLKIIFSGVNLDIGHYNALLRVYLENDYDFTPSDILADLEKRGLEPNRVTYQRLITRYCQKGDITGAMRILEFMREKEMPVNVTVFNALILGHSQAK